MQSEHVMSLQKKKRNVLLILLTTQYISTKMVVENVISA